MLNHLNLIALFFEVARARNFSAAAEALGVERSSVSRGIAALERSLGTQLFSRTTRKLALTSAGTALLREVEPHLRGLEGAISAAADKQALPAGLVRVSVPVDIAVTFLPEVIREFGTRFPAVRLDVRVENRMADVVGEGIDAALRIALEPLPDSTLLAIRLSPLQFNVYASPEHLRAAGQPADIGQAENMTWVPFRGARMKAFPAPGGLVPVIGDDMLFLHQAALAGLGLVVLPTFLAQADVRAGRLIAVLPDVLVDHGELYLLHPPARRMARRVRAFCDYLVGYLERHPLVPTR